MADKPTQLILDALARAAAEPGPLPLFGRPAAPGLFPRTATARLAARKALDDGLLQLAPADAAANGRARDAAAITAAGRAFLAGQLSPRQILDDCVRALEARQAQLAELLLAARRLHEHLDGMKALVQHALPRLPREPEPTAPDCAAEVVAGLERWHEAGAPDDCPLPELFRRLCGARPGLSVGAFHDALRRLHGAGRVYLHPWTGPLYDLPEPACALLVGHEIAYYASLRMGSQQSALSSQPASETGSTDARVLADC